MSDLAAIITASAGVLTVSGGGIAFVWNKVDQGLKEVRKDLKACQEREVESTKREAALLGSLRETSSRHVTVIELLCDEVERWSRGAPSVVLGRARKLLDELKQEAHLDGKVDK